MKKVDKMLENFLNSDIFFGPVDKKNKKIFLLK
jgi:hypothetical protein